VLNATEANAVGHALGILTWKMDLGLRGRSRRAPPAIERLTKAASWSFIAVSKYNARGALPRASYHGEEIMARLVKHDRNLPYEIPEGTELPIFICGCGLSKNKPFCDGSHRKTQDEAASEIYAYDENGRVPVIKQY